MAAATSLDTSSGSYSSTAARPSRARILVTDDEPSGRAGLASLLRMEGFEVDVAENGESALAKLTEIAPDILLTDVRMPGMDGLELQRRAREIYPDLIVVLMTAFGGAQAAVQAMHDGAEGYLPKPREIAE